MKRCLAGLALVSQILGFSHAGWAQTAQKRVLTLYSTRRDARLVDVGDRELPRIIERRTGAAIDYYSESLDQSRFAQPDYVGAVRTFLRTKYQGLSFDAVIAVGDLSFSFVTTSRSELFADAPIVYFAADAGAPRPPNSTGLEAPLNLADSVALAAQLQPSARHLFVITGSTNRNMNFEQVARTQLARFASRFDITYLAGVPVPDLEARLASLPPDSIVYYLAVDRAGADQNIHPLDYVSRVKEVANAPVYSWVDSTMGMGVVGGSLKSQGAEMDAVGVLAARVLRGEAADSIPVATVDLNVHQVDWRAMKRWGLSESRLPAGTQVLFREATLWSEYKDYMLAGVIALTAQTALIAGLLIQASRRRQAERGLVATETKLRGTYNTISDLSGRLLQAQETERSHIARELHDDVGQQVALLVTDLQKVSMGTRIDGRGPEHWLNVALDHAFTLAKSIHDISHRLHPSKLRVLGLPAALDGLQREFSRPGLTISVSHENLPAVINPDVTLCIYRVVQEALQNAMKHSGAREVLVHLNGSGPLLTVNIVDDGVGFDVPAGFGKGLGLISMNERLEGLGGTLTIRSSPKTGVRLKIQVPFEGAAAPSVAV